MKKPKRPSKTKISKEIKDFHLECQLKHRYDELNLRIRNQDKINFKQFIVPEIEKWHPDFEKIMEDGEYFKWAFELKDFMERFKALYSNNPKDIIYSITKFKFRNNKILC